MRCKYCGGEINLSVGRCIGCGRAVDDTADIRILHDLEALAEKYGLDPGSDKYDTDVAAEPQTVLDQRMSAEPLSPDFKTAVVPGIGLDTYYELLGEGMRYDTDPEETQIYVQIPESAEDVQAAEGQSTGNDVEASGDSEQNTPSSEPSEAQADTEEPIGLRRRIDLLLDRVDELTAPVTERVREWYNAKMPRMNRAQSSSKWERLAVIGAVAAALVLVIVIISSIVSAIPASIGGEWRVSDENAQSLLTVEFSGGEVIARVYDDSGEAHIYKTGVYRTDRKNGSDLLTIEYDDGGLSHLYYEISGRTGEFINVDTGTSDRYVRID